MLRVVAAFRRRPRLLAAVAAGLVAALLLPGARLSTRLLGAWDVAVVVHLVLIGWMMARSTEEALQRRADEEDAGAVVVLALSIAASVASLVAIGGDLYGLKQAGTGAATGERLALAAFTVLASWAFVQTIFALHYAHDYYAGETDRGGLAFPGKTPPDYYDFLYFAFTMGAAAQTSDVAVTSPRMRRFVLVHTILAFVFNTTVLALAVNVGASLL